MSISRNSAPQDFTICGRPGTRNSQPKAPKTGWPARSVVFTGLIRIYRISQLVADFTRDEGRGARDEGDWKTLGRDRPGYNAFQIELSWLSLVPRPSPLFPAFQA